MKTRMLSKKSHCHFISRMGSSSSKFKKYLQHGDEFAVMQVFSPLICDDFYFLYENENMIVLISVWALTYRDGNPLKLFTSYHSMIPHTEDALWALLLELPRKTTYMKMEIK